MQYWGKIPLVVDEVKSLADVDYPERAPVDDVYAQIIADFQDAEAKLPVSYGAADQAGLHRARPRRSLPKCTLPASNMSWLLLKPKRLCRPRLPTSCGMPIRMFIRSPMSSARKYIRRVVCRRFVRWPGGALIAFFAQENNPVQGRGFGSFTPTVGAAPEFQRER